MYNYFKGEIMSIDKNASVERKMAANRQAKFRKKSAAVGLKRAGFLISDSVMSQLKILQDAKNFNSINEVISDLLISNIKNDTKIVQVEKLVEVEKIICVDKVVPAEMRVEVNVLTENQKKFIDQAILMLNAFEHWRNFKDEQAAKDGWGFATLKLAKMYFKDNILSVVD